MEYYKKLKELREDNDLTQETIAKIIGCSRKQVIRYENGEQDMTIAKFKTLCAFYKVSADYILGLPKDSKWPR